MPLNSIPKHLKKLPKKTTQVAPGDVVGDLVYVMDKPVGIEEGMVGISVESKPYRQFIIDQFKLLLQKENTNQILDPSDPLYPLYRRYILIKHKIPTPLTEDNSEEI